MRTKFWSENLKGKDQSEELDVDGNRGISCVLEGLCSMELV
jgi:hypothetical protein